jgi:circadian clock protein KaiC
MKRIASGNEALDEILGGGFMANSTILLMGRPGTGKTILAQSLIFHNATPEAPAVFVSTVSEPLDRMLRFVQPFSFFDEEKVDEAIFYEDLGATLRSDGLAEGFARISALVKEHEPAFLVIDSFKALHDFADSRQQFRTHLSALSSLLTALSVTSFLVGEYDPEEISSLPEFAIVDAIIELVLKRVGVSDVRYLRVSKLRGSSFRSGEHAFRLSEHGLDLFPRLRTPASPPSYVLAAGRNATGVPALDAMVREGLWKGSSTLVLGPPGSGKTLLGLHFVFKGIELCEKGILAGMQEDPTQLARTAASFGWDLEKAVATGMLRLLYVSPVDLYIDEFVNEVLTAGEADGTQRLMVDGLGDLFNASGEESRFREFIYSLNRSLAVHGISSIMTQELGDPTAGAKLSAVGTSYMFDNVLMLGVERRGAEVTRSLSVVKTRASQHESGVRQFTISSEGLLVEEPLEESPLPSGAEP